MADLQQETLSGLVMSMLNEGRRREEVEQELMGMGHDAGFVKTLVQETSKLRYARRRVQGLVLILAGAVVCLTSCIITIASGSTGSLPTILYGLTTAGVLVVFAGLMKVF